MNELAWVVTVAGIVVIVVIDLLFLHANQKLRKWNAELEESVAKLQIELDAEHHHNDQLKMAMAIKDIDYKKLETSFNEKQVVANDLYVRYGELENEYAELQRMHETTVGGLQATHETNLKFQAKLDLIKSTGKKLSNGCMMIPRLTAEKLEEDNVNNN